MFLAIILIIISASKLFLAITLTESDINSISTSLLISYEMCTTLMKGILFFDGLTGLFCGLYIVL